MLIEQLSQLIEPVVSSLGYVLWGCELVNVGCKTVLRVYLDCAESDHSISLADCVLVSRRLGAFLDVEANLDVSYTLEVSSPGLDRSLFTLLHYQRFIGRNASLRLHAKQQGSLRFQGKIEAVVDEMIVLHVDKTSLRFPFQQIARGHLLVDPSCMMKS